MRRGAVRRLIPGASERNWAAMKNATPLLLAALSSLALAACEAKKSEETAAPASSDSSKPAVVESTIPVKPEKEPDRIQVQHILIAFQGSGTEATRPKAEAEKLAKEVLDRARRGEDFDELVKKYTDDSPPGIYAMANNGVAPDRAKKEYARGGMVPAFGNVGFAISVGNIDMAPWDAQASPYGWHIIKRLQ